MEMVVTIIGAVILASGLAFFVWALARAAGWADKHQEILGPPNYKIPAPPKPHKTGDDE